MKPGEPKIEPVRQAPPNALSQECRELVEVLNSRTFADKSPRQMWAALLDQGVYLASVSTMYRALRAEGQVRERRAQARHDAKKKPHLVARTFRLPPRWYTDVPANLTIANMDFAEFADATDVSSTFHGFDGE